MNDFWQSADTIIYHFPSQVNWELVSEIILVDIASLHRIGEVSQFINNQASTLSYTITTNQMRLMLKQKQLLLNKLVLPLLF
ncbi:hypothetical protein KHA80_04000 [Anaerobacillus sp. HL2]|nr:hypothetical protein KHA80_04000 [Anaerobacillus sp. HL2]